LPYTALLKTYSYFLDTDLKYIAHALYQVLCGKGAHCIGSVVKINGDTGVLLSNKNALTVKVARVLDSNGRILSRKPSSSEYSLGEISELATRGEVNRLIELFPGLCDAIQF
jgi:hypothetical protein